MSLFLDQPNCVAKVISVRTEKKVMLPYYLVNKQVALLNKLILKSPYMANRLCFLLKETYIQERRSPMITISTMKMKVKRFRATVIRGIVDVI